MKNLPLLLIALLLAMGCSNPYERDNPTDPIHIYKITFTANDATGGTAPAVMSGSYGTVITLPDGSGLVKTGYSFGWWADTSGRFQAGSSYTITGSAAFNAKWVPIRTITFDGNGAIGLAPSAIKADSGSAITLPGRFNLQKTEHTFDGWIANSSGTGTKYKDGSSYYVYNDVTLYAKWIPIYTVTFDGNGATSGTAPAAIKVDSNSAITLPGGGDLERTDYLFAGWNTNSSGTGIGSSYTVSGNATLYASWTSCPGNSKTHICDERDLQVYRTTTIGTQIWMAENLNYNAPDSKCYDNLESNCNIYGRLYHYAMAMDLPASCNTSLCGNQIQAKHKGICPNGWHIPDGWVRSQKELEWEILATAAGGKDVAGKKLKANSGWDWNDEDNISGNGTDEFNFSALPGGGFGDNFGGVGKGGSWWKTYNYPSFLYINYNSDTVWSATNYPNITYKSVRCVRD